MTKKIIILDDHQIFREGLSNLLSKYYPTCQIKHYNSLETFSAIFDEKWTGIEFIILDISLPDGSGLDALERLRQSGFTKPIIVLSMFNEEEYGLKAIKLGASAYLSKTVVSSELIICLKTIEKGDAYLSKNLAQSMLKDLQNKSSKQSVSNILSNREYEVLSLLGQGKRLTDIADSLFISVKTVSTYKTRIFEKLGFSSLSDLIVYCLDNDIKVSTSKVPGY